MCSVGNSLVAEAPLCIRQIFAKLGKRQLLDWAVRLSYVEIYNEAFRDLLAPKNSSMALCISEHRCHIMTRPEKTAVYPCNNAASLPSSWLSRLVRWEGRARHGTCLSPHAKLVAQAGHISKKCPACEMPQCTGCSGSCAAGTPRAVHHFGSWTLLCVAQFSTVRSFLAVLTGAETEAACATRSESALVPFTCCAHPLVRFCQRG